MGKLKEWTLFPQPVTVMAEDEEDAVAKARTLIQHLLSSNGLEFEDVVCDGEAEDSTEIDEDEIAEIDNKPIRREFQDDEDY